MDHMSPLRAITHPTTRAALLDTVAHGLRDGSLYQDGGVIRRALPVGERGRIFAHLYQKGVAPLERAVDWGPKLSQAVGQMQGLVAVSTALSVVNLGVSVAGFVVLARKIDRLERGVKALEAVVQDGLRDVAMRLDRIEDRLVGIATLVRIGQSQTTARLDRLRGQIDWTVVSRMLASVESLSEIEAGRRAGLGPGEHAERLRECRIYLSGAVEDALHDAVEPGPDLLRARALVMLLAQAIVAEAGAWRLAGEARAAARTADGARGTFRDHARRAMLTFLDGDSALLGFDPRLALPDSSPVSMCPAAFLANQPIYDTTSLERTLNARWAVYLGEHPARSKSLLRDPAMTGRRVTDTLALTRPVAEAMGVIEGVAEEYRLLAERGVSYADWEGAQVGEPFESVLVIRETV